MYLQKVISKIIIFCLRLWRSLTKREGSGAEAGAGSVPKCHGSETLWKIQVKTEIFLNWPWDHANKSFIFLFLYFIPAPDQKPRLSWFLGHFLLYECQIGTEYFKETFLAPYGTTNSCNGLLFQCLMPCLIVAVWARVAYPHVGNLHVFVDLIPEMGDVGALLAPDFR